MPVNELLLRTKRLDLVAATLAHLEAELASPSTLGPLLGVSIPPGWPPGGPDHVGWYTWYGITRNSQGQRDALVAGAGYMGPPSSGIAEIGYSVIPSARRQGYATELVMALVRHAFTVPSIQQVIAHTSDANEASTQVLLRCGFERVEPGSEPESVQYRTRRTPYA
jgi:GNAT superfamily N-acetyltransferase